MKNVVAPSLAVAALLAALPAVAQDHPVPQDALAALGLGKMTSVSDARGMSVRGRGTFASVAGGSSAFGSVTHHGAMSTVTFGAIDANSYKAFEESVFKKTAQAQASPAVSSVVIPIVQVEENGKTVFSAQGAILAGTTVSPKAIGGITPSFKKF